MTTPLAAVDPLKCFVCRGLTSVLSPLAGVLSTDPSRLACTAASGILQAQTTSARRALGPASVNLKQDCIGVHSQAYNSTTDVCGKVLVSKRGCYEQSMLLVQLQVQTICTRMSPDRGLTRFAEKQHSQDYGRASAPQPTLHLGHPTSQADGFATALWGATTVQAAVVCEPDVASWRRVQPSFKVRQLLDASAWSGLLCLQALTYSM